MSLIRQIWLLLLGTLVLAFAAGTLINIGSVRDTLQTQLNQKNSDNATALAQVLSQHKGQRELMELTLSAQFDTGFYRRIRLVGADAQPSSTAAATPRRSTRPTGSSRSCRSNRSPAWRRWRMAGVHSVRSR